MTLREKPNVKALITKFEQLDSSPKMVDNFINKWLNNFNKYESRPQVHGASKTDGEDTAIGANIIISIANKSNPTIETQKSTPNFKVTTKEINGSYSHVEKHTETVVPQIEVRTLISVPNLNTTTTALKPRDYDDKKSPNSTPRKLQFGALTTRAIVDLTADESDSANNTPRSMNKSESYLKGEGEVDDLIAMMGGDIQLDSHYQLHDQDSDVDEDGADFEEDEEPAAPVEDTRQFVQLQQQVQELQKRISELENQQQQRTRAESDLRQMNLSLIKQVQKLKDSNNDLEDENDDLAQQLNELRESHMLMMTEKSIQALNQHEEIDRLNEVITSQRNSHLELSRMNDELHTQCTRLQNGHAKLRDQLLDVLADEAKDDQAKLALVQFYLQGEHGHLTPPAQRRLAVSFTGSDEHKVRSMPSSPAHSGPDRVRRHSRHSSMNEDKPVAAKHLNVEPPSSPASPGKGARKTVAKEDSPPRVKAKRSLSIKKGTKL